MYLLDTHAMLWYLRDSPELSASAHSLIDKAEYVAVSIASFWERRLPGGVSILPRIHIANHPQNFNFANSRLKPAGKCGILFPSCPKKGEAVDL